MATDTLGWLADVDPAVTSYTLNGVPGAPVSVPAVAGQAAYTYSFPAVAGATYTPTIQSVDSFGQTSPVIACTPPSVTVPTPPPAPPTGPTNFTQTLS